MRTLQMACVLTMESFAERSQLNDFFVALFGPVRLHSLTSSLSKWRLESDVIRDWRDSTSFAKEDDMSVVVQPNL